MALVRSIEKSEMERNSVHGTEVDCEYSIFSDHSGKRYLQIDTFGSDSRQEKGKKSQTIQFDEKSVSRLASIIAKHFPVR